MYFETRDFSTVKFAFGLKYSAAVDLGKLSEKALCLEAHLQLKFTLQILKMY